MLQYFTSFTYNITIFIIVQMYAGISPEILQFLRTLKYITELYQINRHQVEHVYINWQYKYETYNVTMSVMLLNIGKSWFGPSISLILLYKEDANHEAKPFIKIQIQTHILSSYWMDMRRLFTHNSFKLFRRDIFRGIGPLSPLASISLQEFKFEWQ